MALLGVAALVVPVTHLVSVQKALLVLVVGSLLLWLISLFPCLASSALSSTLHVGCLAVAPLVVALAGVALAGVALAGVALAGVAPMVSLMFPREGSSLGSLVGACLVRLESLCVVAVRLLILSLLGLELVGLVLGPSWL